MQVTLKKECLNHWEVLLGGSSKTKAHHLIEEKKCHC